MPIQFTLGLYCIEKMPDMCCMATRLHALVGSNRCPGAQKNAEMAECRLSQQEHQRSELALNGSTNLQFCTDICELQFAACFAGCCCSDYDMGTAAFHASGVPLSMLSISDCPLHSRRLQLLIHTAARPLLRVLTKVCIFRTFAFAVPNL